MEDFFEQEITEDPSSFDEALGAAKHFIRDKKIADKLSKEKIKEQLDKFTEKAKKIIDNPEKVSEVLRKATDLCDDLGQIRFVGKYFREISDICSMINDYICKEYTAVPMATVITLLASVLYFISPIDLIPDFLPLIGHLDDMLVFSLVRDAVKVDLNKYKRWKEEKAKNDLISEN